MSIKSRYRPFLIFAVVAACIAAVPTLAEAQRRRPVARGQVVRSVVYVGPYYSRFYYDPWYQWGYPYPFPPYGARGYYDFNASVRIQVTPRDAEVFVDGYLAGKVDDFDGVFQRLRVRPGGHEITIFIEGYETAREAVYLEAGSERKLQFSLNKLAAGQRSEPPPQPTVAAEDEQAEAMPRSGPSTRRPPVIERESPAEVGPPAPGRFGTLSLRVQPANAEILIDGERWAAPSGQDRISIQLSEGRHKIEVRREGMNAYTEEILVRRGATFTLNVSLATAR